jgi:hypothetical protein
MYRSGRVALRQRVPLEPVRAKPYAAHPRPM